MASEIKTIAVKFVPDKVELVHAVRTGKYRVNRITQNGILMSGWFDYETALKQYDSIKLNGCKSDTIGLIWKYCLQISDLFRPLNHQIERIMPVIKTENESYLIYSIHEDKIDIENIKSYKKGDGSKLINQLKEIAFDLGDLPIELYSYPQDDTITQDGLNAFYEKNGFELHPDDCDGRYYAYSKC